MVDVLALVLLHREQLVKQAITAALEVEQPSKQHVLDCPSRLSDVPIPKPLGTPPSLRLVTKPMADTIAEMPTQSSPDYQQAMPVLQTLPKAEVAERDARSINYQMKAAKFPAYHDLAGIDFNQSAADEALARSLRRCEFLEDAQNIAFAGRPGTGKTHLATAIAAQAIQHHRYRVRFLPTIELVNTLER